MKKMFALFLCLCILFPACPLTALAEDEPGAEEPSAMTTDDDLTNEADVPATPGEEPAPEPVPEDDNIEDYYSGTTTNYDLTNEVDVPVIPEETLPPPPAPEDDESEIYDDSSFDAENARQLASPHVSDEIIVRFKEPWQVPGKEKQLQHEIEKAQKVGFVEGLGVYVVRAEDLSSNPNAILNRFKNNRFIEHVEPNYIMDFDYIPNDPRYKTYQTAALNALNAPACWDIIKGGGPIVAVVDSGVVSHPDLPPLLSGYSAVAELAPGNDRRGHGTSVAGVIGAVGDNALGGAGLNWNASILPVKVDDTGGTMTVSNVARGIIWAADNGARIINISLGTIGDSSTLKDAIDYAYNSGCAIFAAAGNEGSGTICYPARYSNVMAVGSSPDAVTRAPESNYGEGMDVVALSSYHTTTSSGGFANSAGTSFATAQASGLASLLWAIDPGLTNDQIYSLIRQGAKPLGGGYNEHTGYGLIDFAKTIELAGGVAAPEPTPEVPIDTPEPTPVPLPPETPQEEVRTPPVIKLTGFTDLTLEYGQTYNEMGYTAVDCKGVDLTHAVTVANTVNIQVPGLYTITYEVADSAGLTARATRTVTVSAPLPPVPPQAPKITIIGSDPIVLHLTSATPYTEQGARAIDYDGADISGYVTISGAVNRNVADTYTVTYSVTSPRSGLTATATRNVRIAAPTERKDPRVKYGLSGQAKQGGKVTHTGVVSGAVGFMDLKVAGIDKNMTISVELVDTATGKAAAKDTFTAAGAQQYRIDRGSYELAVMVDKANGNSKYNIELLMPETTVFEFIDDEEVPLASFIGVPKIAPVGSNPIILHLGGTSYTEQGARAVDYDGEDISDKVEIIGAPNTGKAGTYDVTYRVTNDLGFMAEVTRQVRVLAPGEEGIFEDEEVPLADLPAADSSDLQTIYFALPALLLIAAGVLIIRIRKKKTH